MKLESIYYNARAMKKICLYVFVIVVCLSCSSHKTALDAFDAILSKSDRIMIRFDRDKNFNKKNTYVFINSSSQIDEFRGLLQKSTEGTGCNERDGAMTFYSGTEITGHLEFNSNPYCAAFYLEYAGKKIEYKMYPYCGMFLESTRQLGN